LNPLIPGGEGRGFCKGSVKTKRTAVFQPKGLKGGKKGGSAYIHREGKKKRRAPMRSQGVQEALEIGGNLLIFLF